MLDHLQCPPVPGMVMIPHGWFLMGSTEAETQTDINDPEADYLRASRPQHRVYLPSFYIDRFPVTYSDYKAFTDATGYETPYWSRLGKVERGMRYDWNRRTRSFNPGLERHPIVCVTWYDALAYCDWIGKRLPTEAEWEKAARGSDGRPYPWGWDNDLKTYCHVYLHHTDVPDPRLEMSPVDSHPLGVSPFGCYDMLGNCDEWCADWFDETYYAVASAHSPSGPPMPIERFRSVRGCGRYWPEQHAALRGQQQPWQKDRGTSFRCALSIDAVHASTLLIPPP